MSPENIESIKAMLLARIPQGIIAAKMRTSRRTVYRIKYAMGSMFSDDPVRFIGDVPAAAIITQARIYGHTERGQQEKAHNADTSEADLALSPKIAPIAAAVHVQSLEETLD